MLNRLCLPDYHEGGLKERFEEIIKSLGLDNFQQYVADIGKAWPVLLMTVGIALVTIVLYTLFLSF